jgi:hypothetical protein
MQQGSGMLSRRSMEGLKSCLLLQGAPSSCRQGEERCAVFTCVAHLIQAGMRSTHSPYAVSTRTFTLDLRAPEQAPCAGITTPPWLCHTTK